MKLFTQTRRSKRGAALVEYGLIVAGVALVAVAAVSIFGHKTAGMMAQSAAILPGAQAEDNGIIEAGRVVKTQNDNGTIGLADDVGNQTMGDNLGTDTSGLITDPSGSNQ
ncbi:MAG: hypothetical protein HZA53_09035 [Planctomycetes bacterium]|nr:hypothetical protein [Planctomycetota bacterium]